MAITGTLPGSGQGAQYLKSIWASEMPVNPTEEAKIADFVTQPIGTQKFGNLLTVRKIPTVTLAVMAASSNGEDLSDSTNQQAVVTASPRAETAFVQMSLHELTRAVDDANLQAGYRKQMMATLVEGLDIQLFSKVAGFTQSESGADFDKTMFLSALGKLAEFGKGRVSIGETTIRLIVHPREIKNVMATDIFNFAYIRGDNASGAKDGLVRNAYGAQIRESGLVYNPSGTAYQPLITQEALMLAWNQKPTMLDVQPYLAGLRFVAWQEYGVAVQFDQFGVSLNTTV